MDDAAAGLACVCGVTPYSFGLFLNFMESLKNLIFLREIGQQLIDKLQQSLMAVDIL